MREEEQTERDVAAQLRSLEFAAVLVAKDFASVVNVEAPGDVRLGFRHAGRRWRGQLIIHERERLVRFHAFVDRPFTLLRLPVLLELAARLNSVLISGTVVVDVSHGAVEFRNSRWLAKTEGDVAGVRSLLNSSAVALDLLAESWTHFAAGLSASDCTALASIRLGLASDRISISQRGMRELLTVQHGPGRSRASDKRPSLVLV